eukprot:768408-Hanusia_phi.AAC.2
MAEGVGCEQDLPRNPVFFKSLLRRPVQVRGIGGVEERRWRSAGGTRITVPGKGRGGDEKMGT